MHEVIKFWNQLQEAIDDAVSEVGKSTRQTYFIGKVKDTGDSYTVSVELPGFEKEEIHLSIVGDFLHIDAKNNDRAANKAYALPSNVNKDSVEAALKNGILTVTIKKKEATRRTRIEIK